jgi:hypothetical protein
LFPPLLSSPLSSFLLLASFLSLLLSSFLLATVAVGVAIVLLRRCRHRCRCEWWMW